MKAIILAAGRGARLKICKKSYPKCFIKIKNKKLIDYQIEALTKIGVKDIYIITGFKKYFFKNIKKKKIHNKNWDKTNMVKSLMCADKILKKNSCIVSYSDIIYDASGLLSLIKSNYQISILFDKKWKKLWRKRFKNPLSDAETFKVDKNNNLTEIGKKTNSYLNIKGQYMGLIKFKPSGWKKFKITLKVYFKNSFCKNHLTDVFQKMIENDILKIKAIKFNGRWCEIDFPSDIKVAQDIFSKNGI